MMERRAQSLEKKVLLWFQELFITNVNKIKKNVHVTGKAVNYKHGSGLTATFSLEKADSGSPKQLMEKKRKLFSCITYSWEGRITYHG